MWRFVPQLRLKSLLFLATISVCLAVGGVQRPKPVIEQPQEREPVKESKLILQQVPSPYDLYKMALEDSKTLNIESRLFTRYIATRGNKISVKMTSLALNYVSRATGIIRPLPVADGHLVRIDLRWYAPREQDTAEWLGFWEQLAFDPMFSLIVTRDAVEISKNFILPLDKTLEPQPQRTEKRIITHAGGFFKAPDDSGREWENLEAGKYEFTLRFNTPPVEKISTPFDNKDVNALRFNPEHLNGIADELQKVLGTQAPVVDHRYLKHRLLTTIKDQQVYKAVFGGLYYEFRGIKKVKDVLKDSKATDLDLFFENLGIGNIKAGLTAKQLFDKLRSDQRVAVFRSLVTGKPREVSMFHTPATREVASWGAITGDVKDGDIDVGDRPYRNLLNPRRKAREAIFPSPNGTLIFALFNDKEELQDEVPPDIANDHTIPFPYTKRLEAPKGCIICHGIDGSDGWKPLTNDVLKLLGGKPKLDVFDDFSLKVRTTSDVIDRLAGLYTGDFSKNLRRAREDTIEITLRMIGPMEGGVGDQTDITKLAAQTLLQDFVDYEYTMVDAKQALLEEGWDVDKEHAVSVFNRLHPPHERSTLFGIIPEDPIIAALKNGDTVPRYDWSLSYAFAMERSLLSPERTKLLKEVKQK